MKEQGGPVIMVLGLFSLLWLLGSSPAKVEPVDMPVDGLVEVMSRASETLEIQHGHETDFAIIDHIADVSKMVQPSPSDRHEKINREIIIFTRPNCPPCDQWKRCEQAKFEADGWTVAYCDQHNFGLTPHFSIEKNGKTYDYKGYLPFAKIDEATR